MGGVLRVVAILTGSCVCVLRVLRVFLVTVVLCCVGVSGGGGYSTCERYRGCSILMICSRDTSSMFSGYVPPTTVVVLSLFLVYRC